MVNAKKTIGIVGLLIWSLTSIPVLHADDSSPGATSSAGSSLSATGEKSRVSKMIRMHLDQEAYYKKKAAEEETIISEHQKEKHEFYRKYFINEKLTPKFRLRPMVRHCDIIIHEARKMRRQFLMFAHWHKMRAEELEKK